MAENFHSPRPNLVESDQGFAVEVLGKTGLLYTEGVRTMNIYSELLAPGRSADTAIWTNSISKWKPPHDGEVIDQQERTRILENIRRAIRFAGDDIDVIG
jgi:hypothetical protein